MMVIIIADIIRHVPTTDEIAFSRSLSHHARDAQNIIQQAAL